LVEPWRLLADLPFITVDGAEHGVGLLDGDDTESSPALLSTTTGGVWGECAEDRRSVAHTGGPHRAQSGLLEVVGVDRHVEDCTDDRRMRGTRGTG